MLRKIWWVLLLVPLITAGQDYRFSQFYNAPLLINPAFAGDHNQHYRLFMNYRNQWSAITNAFTTVSGSFDMPAFEDVGGTSKFGAGISFLNDKAGTTNYGFTNVNFNLAYHLRTTRFSKVSAGLVFGYGQSNIDLSNVRWENQHNGNNYDPSLPSGESVFADKIIYLDAGMGLLYTSIDPDYDRKYVFGLSATHLNYPNHSFIGQYQNRLKPKLQLHGEVDLGFEFVTVKPKILIMNQGPSTSFTLGSMFGFDLGTQPDSRYTDAYVGSSFEIGMFYRYDESLFFAAQYNFKKNLMIGISYDIILSDLAATTNSGGYEIALRYQGLFSNPRIKVKKDMDDSKDNGGKKKKNKGDKVIRM